jgi:hypothetical protein
MPWKLLGRAEGDENFQNCLFQLRFKFAPPKYVRIGVDNIFTRKFVQCKLPARRDSADVMQYGWMTILCRITEWAVCIIHLCTQEVEIECNRRAEELEKEKEEKLKEEQGVRR